MNEHYIQINGKTPIEAKPEDEHEISVAFKCLFPAGVAIKPLEDGGKAYTYKYKNIGEVTVINEKEVIRGKAKGKQSVALRMAIREYALQNGLNEDEYYIKRMSEIINGENNKI